MLFSRMDFPLLSPETLRLLGEDYDRTCDYVMERADKLWGSFGERWSYNGQRHFIDRKNITDPRYGPLRVIEFAKHGPEVKKTTLIVARGTDDLEREYMAWAEIPERVKYPGAQKFLHMHFRNYLECGASVLAAVKCDDGEWHNLSPLWALRLDKWDVKWTLDWETASL